MKDFLDKLENLVGDFSGYYPNGQGLNPFTFLLAPILGFLLFFFLILGNWKSILHWIDKSSANNQIQVVVDKGLELGDVQIGWKMDYTNEVIIFDKGKVLYTEFFERGNNHFSINYNDSSIAEFMHYKETGLDGHDYTISLHKSLRCIMAEVEITGESDSLKWLKKPNCQTH